MTLFFAQRNASSGRQGAVAVGESFFTSSQLSQRCQRLDWRVLEDAMSWHMGWK